MNYFWVFAGVLCTAVVISVALSKQFPTTTEADKTKR
jgi:hypothetical protein